MATYQLPCPECESVMEVGARHAGQTRECTNCQVPVEVPKLGQLRQLPLAIAEGDVGRRRRGPSQTRSWMFSGGLLIASLFGLGGFALHTYAKDLYSDIGNFTEQFAQVSEERINEMPVHELFEWWSTTSKSDLGEWKEHQGVGYNVQSGILTNIAFGMFALAGLGLLSMLVSTLL